MCGRFVITKNLSEALPDLLANLSEWDSDFVSYNIAPGTEIPIVVEKSNSTTGEISRMADWAHWGFVPAWKKSFTERPQPINARVETVDTNGMFRQAFARRRCLIPASGYYEWLLSNDGQKQPYYITSPERGLAFAGIYEDWVDSENHNNIRRSVAILTRPSVGPAAFIHDRLPLMLDSTVYGMWLGSELADPQQAHQLLANSSEIFAQNLEYWKVGNAVGNVRNNDAHLIEPVTG